MRTRAVLAALLFFLLTIGIPLATAAIEATHIEVGDRNTITATVSNPLDIPDVHRVNFNGEAINEELIDVSLPTEKPDTNCNPGGNSCRIKLEPDEQQDLEFHLEGEKAGRGEFYVTVSSENTGKRAHASRLVVVRGHPFKGIMEFMVQILGTT
ncbi:MAG: hypothetical protein MUP63_02300 [Candidatus Nanohaloarchaeota archaeon QJJ-7]|nr:hypothetical protein [Candidatus Nanohaloarchaeota archaeon QJJ-7]